MKPYVKIKVKQAYGNTRYYPDCENSNNFCKLAGSKTLTLEQLKVIKDLGFSIIKSQSEEEKIFDKKKLTPNT